MWLSKKEWSALKERVADLEKEVKEIRSQPEEIAKYLAESFNKQMSKSGPKTRR